MDISRRRFFARHKSEASPLRPPWSLSEALFTDLCTRCDACIKVCPTDLLVRGDDGFPMPDFMRGQCTFCGDCARACVPGAINSDLTQPPWFFGIKISEGCLAAQNVECRVCGEMCEANAIRFKPRMGGVPLPEVDNASCTSCGACIAPCPVVAVLRVTTHPALELS
jgi:ferredoxin-type protein NapF